MSTLFGRHSRQFLILALVIALLVPATAGVATAQSFEGAAGTVIVEEGSTYDSIDGVAGTIVIRGTVTGDVSGAAGTIHVTESGVVEGSIEGAAGTVRIDGTVNGDVKTGAGTLEIGESGTIGGTLQGGAGYIRIDGAIDGDVKVGSQTLVVGPSAVIGGEFRYDAADFERHNDATFNGDVVRDRSLSGQFGPRAGDFTGFHLPSWASTLYEFMANLVLGVLLLFAFPRFSTGVANRVADEPLKSGGVGLVTLIAIPIALVLIMLTIIGIPVGILGIIAFAFMIWVGVVYGQYAIGSWVLGLLGGDNRWLALVGGLAGFAIIGVIPILGSFLELIAFLLGLGALALGLRATYRDRGNDSDEAGHQATLEDVSG